MKLLLHKDRHVCVAPDLDESADALEGEEVSVLWVAVAPDVQGVARRGRPPAHQKKQKAFPSSEFTLLDHAVAGEDLLRKARKACDEFAQPALVEASTSEESKQD